MDVYPFTRGHVLVIPKQHAARLHELTPAMRQRLFEVGNRIGLALRQQPLPCDDLNFIINDGKRANQHVPHVHLHVIPRVRGDGRQLLWQMSTRFLNPVRRPDRLRFDSEARLIAAALAALPETTSDS